MIEIFHEMIRYEVHINEIFCCDCYFDEIYFFLRKEKTMNFSKKFFQKNIIVILIVFLLHLQLFVMIF